MGRDSSELSQYFDDGGSDKRRVEDTAMDLIGGDSWGHYIYKISMMKEEMWKLGSYHESIDIF